MLEIDNNAKSLEAIDDYFRNQTKFFLRQLGLAVVQIASGRWLPGSPGRRLGLTKSKPGLELHSLGTSPKLIPAIIKEQS